MTETVTVKIKNRWTGVVQFTASVDASLSIGLRIGAAVKLAIKTRADLTDADLTRADLTRAVLTGAVLTGAVLTDADLTGADLTGADLTDADLTRAVLTRADLTDAGLTRAVLTDADLTRADLTRADLTDADGTRADLTDADGIHLPTPEEAERRIRAVAQAALASDSALEMGEWHKCETAHCIAGWAIHNEGPVGYILEKAVGAPMAGLMLLGVEAHSHFYDDNEKARAWLQSKLA